MRIKTRSIVVALATIGLMGSATVAATTASADPEYHQPVVSTVWKFVVAPLHTDTAIVTARYQCWGGNAHTHLFIAVKQGPQVNATTHTSSKWAKTFYSTNYNADGPGLSVNCNGVSHKQSFVLRPDPYFEQLAPLHSGPAFVQFCLFDSTNEGENDPNGFAFNYSMRTVVQRDSEV